jgi:hypothetical protein
VTWFSLLPYVVLPALVCGVAWWVVRDQHADDMDHEPDPSPWWLVVLWCAVPVGLAWLLTWGDVCRLFFPRYLVVCAAGPIVFAGLCLGRLPAAGARAGTALLIVGVALVSSGLVQQWRHDGRLLSERRQDWRGAVRWLAAQEQENGIKLPVLVRSGLLEADQLTLRRSPLLRQYCLSPVLGLYDLSAAAPRLVPLPTRAAPLEEALVREIVTRDGAWLLINGSIGSRAQVRAAIMAQFKEGGWGAVVRQVKSFPGIDLVEIRISASP